MRALYGDGEKMIDFTKDGKRFIAGRGFMTSFDKNGDKEFSVIDVFREEDPTEERVCELYKTLKEIADDK
jgi:hypothetical protein